MKDAATWLGGQRASALGAIRTPNLLIRSGLNVVAVCDNVSHSVAS